ncbi:MAG: murein biosynthesis integral membrane protein MurJ [Oligoflexia bacterium]|nr:murein biosynthesis integral membrane protein MurJ [Oligoflexia bacterium]
MKQPSEPGVLRAAGLMGAATFLSRILGLVREQVFAILFGAGNVMDAFIVAFRIPNLLRDLFAEGAMSASFVPTFTRARIEEGDRRAWRLAGLVFRVLFVTVGTLALLGILFAPELVGWYAGAFKQVPGKFELTVRMTRIMFPFFPLVALAAAFMGILNACGIFFLPALASALFNLASIIAGVSATLLLFRYGGEWGIQPIEGMAFGVLVGGLVQAFCQLPALYRAGYRWQARLQGEPVWQRDPALRRMLWMMLPGTVGLAATQVNILVNTILATSQGPGAASWLSYAFRLMQFPIGIFGVSLAAAVLPRVSRQWVEKDWSGVSETLSRSLRQVLAINLPASAGLAFLGYPIVELIFQYGRFQASDTARTALALAMYSMGLTAYSGVKVLVPACYAMGNARIPVISSVFTVVATVILNLAIVGSLGYWGLALGTSVGALLNFAFLLHAARKLIGQQGGSFPFAPVLRAFFAHFGISLVMGVTCYASYRGLSRLFPEPAVEGVLTQSAVVLGRALKVGFLVLEGAFLTIFLGRAFGVTDTSEVIDLFMRKIKKKLSRGKT